MPKFLVGRDIAFLRNVARELVEKVIEETCVLFKVNLNETKVNIYGESANKTWHRGVELYVLINKEPEAPILAPLPHLRLHLTLELIFKL